MAAETTPLNQLEQYADSVYEAIIMIAKRARQINEEQKVFIESEIGPIDDSVNGEDDEENDVVEKEELNFIKLPKPTSLALNEFFDGKIEYEYLKKEEAENEA
jgi:DNA-directed RNA polymerase subunit K/omega